MADPIGFVVAIVENIVRWLQELVPGGFGLLFIPLAVLGIISLIAARNR
jgi:hypothetical protein